MTEVDRHAQDGTPHWSNGQGAFQPWTEDEDDFREEQDESMDPAEESGCTDTVIDSDEEEEEDEEIDELVLEDMQKFEESFKGITQRYKIMNRIGEGMRR